MLTLELISWNVPLFPFVGGSSFDPNGSGIILLESVVLESVVLESVVLESVVLESVLLESVVLESVVLESVELESVVLESVVLGSVVLGVVESSVKINLFPVAFLPSSLSSSKGDFQVVLENAKV